MTVRQDILEEMQRKLAVTLKAFTFYTNKGYIVDTRGSDNLLSKYILETRLYEDMHGNSCKIDGSFVLRFVSEQAAQAFAKSYNNKKIGGIP